MAVIRDFIPIDGFGFNFEMDNCYNSYINTSEMEYIM